MIVIEGILSPALFQRCIDETTAKMQEHCWRPSSFFWEDFIRKGVQAPCIVTRASTELAQAIEAEIKPYIPSFDYLTIQHYIWLPNSAISPHDDAHVKFGATIYLNEDWGPSDGGFFIWQDKTNQEWKTLIPKKNTAVLNDNQEVHLVTPVNAAVAKFRVTLQIWGHDPFTRSGK